MKLVQILGLTALSVALAGCETLGFGGSSSSAAENTENKPVQVAQPVVPATKTDARLVEKKGNGDIEIYVGSVTQSNASKNKKSTGKETSIKSGGQTYVTSGALLSREDVKTAFVAKAKDQPALALRLTPAGATKLKTAITGKSNQHKVVLASMNKSVFSTLSTSEAALEDGVLLIPMLTLVNARDAADLIRAKR